MFEYRSHVLNVEAASGERVKAFQLTTDSDRTALRGLLEREAASDRRVTFQDYGSLSNRSDKPAEDSGERVSERWALSEQVRSQALSRRDSIGQRFPRR